MTSTPHTAPCRFKVIRFDNRRFGPYLVRRSRWAGVVGVDLGRRRFLVTFGTKAAWR